MFYVIRVELTTLCILLKCVDLVLHLLSSVVSGSGFGFKSFVSLVGMVI